MFFHLCWTALKIRLIPVGITRDVGQNTAKITCDDFQKKLHLRPHTCHLRPLGSATVQINLADWLIWSTNQGSRRVADPSRRWCRAFLRGT
jgi:hypothetical protein